MITVPITPMMRIVMVFTAGMSVLCLSFCLAEAITSLIMLVMRAVTTSSSLVTPMMAESHLQAWS